MILQLPPNRPAFIGQRPGLGPPAGVSTCGQAQDRLRECSTDWFDRKGIDDNRAQCFQHQRTEYASVARSFDHDRGGLMTGKLAAQGTGTRSSSRQQD
jgi:hypothetical protein